MMKFKKLLHFVKLSGKITYNGHELNEFVPQRTSSYVSQKDCHMAEMTVRETLQFAESCQGFGYKQGKLKVIIPFFICLLLDFVPIYSISTSLMHKIWYYENLIQI